MHHHAVFPFLTCKSTLLLIPTAFLSPSSARQYAPEKKRVAKACPIMTAQYNARDTSFEKWSTSPQESWQRTVVGPGSTSLSTGHPASYSVANQSYLRQSPPRPRPCPPASCGITLSKKQKVVSLPTITKDVTSFVSAWKVSKCSFKQ